MTPHAPASGPRRVVGYRCMKHKIAAKSPTHRRTRAAPQAISKSGQVLAAPDGSFTVGLAIRGSQLWIGSINGALASMNGTPVQDPFTSLDVKYGGQNGPFPRNLRFE